MTDIRNTAFPPPLSRLQTMDDYCQSLRALLGSDNPHGRNALSHELRTPLAVISGYVQMLEDESASDLKHLTAPILDAVKRLTRVVDCLVESETTAPTRMEKVTRMVPQREESGSRIPLLHLTNRVVELVSDRYPDQETRIALDLDEKLSLPASKAHCIATALDHVVDNAFKYSEGGDIRIRAAVVDHSLVIKVRDDGPGIPGNSIPLFAPFRQGSEGLSRRSNGLGMGLFLAKKAMGSVSGSISIQNCRKGKGAIATLACPMESASIRTLTSPVNLAA